MYTQSEKSIENKRHALAYTVSQKKSSKNQNLVFTDNRPITHKEQILQQANNRQINNNLVIQQTKTGAVIGSAIGGALGTLGFLGGPAMGSVTTALGIGLGGLAGNYLTGSESREISIAEDEVKTAETADTIKYPSVTSCMTITLVLKNGKKVGGHIGLYAGPANGVIRRMNAAKGGARIRAIRAKGHGSIWGTHLENTETLRPMIREEFLRRHNGGDFESIGFEEFGEIQGSLSIQQNQDTFCTWIATQFGGADEVEYKNTGDGDLYIAANGRIV